VRHLTGKKLEDNIDFLNVKKINILFGLFSQSVSNVVDLINLIDELINYESK